MRIIAIENNVVVDVFETDNVGYVEQRQKNRPDIEFIYSNVGYMGQIFVDGVFTDAPVTMNNDDYVRLTLEDKIDLILLRSEGVIL